MDGPNLFDVVVPDEELARPAFEPLPTGVYQTTLMGAEEVSNADGWHGVRLTFEGFTGANREWNRTLRAQFTTAHPTSQQAVQIGYSGLIGAAAAFGLTQPTTTPDGKTGQKLVATSTEELVGQLQQVAGTVVEVYVKTGVRKKQGKIVLKDDGTPWVDSEVKRISPIQKGDG